MRRTLFFLLLVSAFFVRAYDLGSESYWTDELYSLRTAHKDVMGIIKNDDMHPPTFYLMLGAWVRMFGDSEAGTRSLSLVLGLLGIIAIYRLGKLLFDRRTGFSAAVITAFSAFQIQYSQELRSYSLLFLIGAVSYYYFVRYWMRSGRPVHLTGYALSSLTLLYIHNYGALVVISQNVYFLMLWAARRKSERPPFAQWVMVQAILLVSFIPWLLFSMGYSKTVSKNFWIPMPGVRALLDTFREYSGGYKCLALAALTVILSFPAWKKAGRNERENLTLLGVWMGTTLLIPFAISLLWTPIYYFRYTIITSVAFYVFVAYAFNQIPWKLAKWVVVVLYAALTLLSVRLYYEEQKKEDWRGATSYVNERLEDGDRLVFHLSGLDVYDYYSKTEKKTERMLFPRRTVGAIVGEDWKFVTPANLPALEEFVSGCKRVWLIYSHARDREHLLMRELERLGYVLRDQKLLAPKGVAPDANGDSRVLEVRLYSRE